MNNGNLIFTLSVLLTVVVLQWAVKPLLKKYQNRSWYGFLMSIMVVALTLIWGGIIFVTGLFVETGVAQTIYDLFFEVAVTVFIYEFVRNTIRMIRKNGTEKLP